MTPLQDVMRSPIQYGIVQTGTVDSDGVPCIRVVDLTPDELDVGGVVRVHPAVHAKYRKTTLATGDLLFALRGDIGMVRQVPPRLVGANIHRGIARLSPNPDSVDSSYVLHALQATSVASEIHQRVTGSALKELPINQLRKLRIPVPPLEVQRAIARFLNLHALHLADHLALLRAKLAYKDGIALQLLSGRTRFRQFEVTAVRQNTPFGDIPLDWEYPLVGDIAREISLRAGTGNESPVLACSKYDGLVESLSYFGRQIFSSDTSNYRVVRRGQFAFPANHIEEGSIGLLRDHPEGLVSPIYIVFEPTARVEPEFLYAVFKSKTYRQIFSAATNSSVNRRGSLRWAEFRKLRVPLPSTEEQSRIVDILLALEREIDGLQRFVALLDKQRNALLDKLLSGELRLPRT